MTSADFDMLRKHGKNLAERLDELSSVPHLAALSAPVNRADFGNTAEAGDAAKSYAESLAALRDAVHRLCEAGVAHARALRKSADAYEEVDGENAANVRDRSQD
jgi:uncharacterized protein YukE